MPNSPARQLTYPLLKQGLSAKEVIEKTGCSKTTVNKHRIELFGPSPSRRPHDWIEVQKYYDAGNRFVECRKRFGFRHQTWIKAIQEGKLLVDPTRKRFKTIIRPDHKCGRLTTIRYLGVLPDKGGTWWLCKCDCGNEVEILGSHINQRRRRSCGCSKLAFGPLNIKWGGHGEISAAFWGRIRLNAESRKVPIEISIEEAWDLFLKQERKCRLSGEQLEMLEPQGKTLRTASLDRIDSSKGYTLDNIQWVHKDINMMKQDHSDEDFLNWIDKIYHFQHHERPSSQANLLGAKP